MLHFVAVLCVAQFLWTCHAERVALGPMDILLAVCAFVLALAGFERIGTWGRLLSHAPRSGTSLHRGNGRTARSFGDSGSHIRWPRALARGKGDQRA